MKKLCLLAAFTLGLSGAATAQQAEPSTNVAWTIDTLNLLRSGDVARGDALNVSLECASCHGANGISGNESWPNLAGHPAGYLFKVMKDYQDGKLSGTDRGQLMAFIVEEMSDQDMADVAAYLAAQEAPPLLEAAATAPALALDTLGDPKRLIPPCSVCHGNKSQGDFPDCPALAGQSPEFLARAMGDFKTGARGNDVYSRMRLIAAQLTPEEISALADYYAAGGSRAPQE